MIPWQRTTIIDYLSGIYYFNGPPVGSIQVARFKHYVSTKNALIFSETKVSSLSKNFNISLASCEEHDGSAYFLFITRTWNPKGSCSNGNYKQILQQIYVKKYKSSGLNINLRWNLSIQYEFCKIQNSQYLYF